MPTRIKLIGRYANGVVAALFTILFVYGLGKGELSIALFCGIVAALCGFNLYVMEKAAALLSEEEWLKAELRKAELRRKLVNLTGNTPETVGRNHGL